MAREVDGDFDDDDGGGAIVKADVSALEAISRSEVAMQLDAAHRWPRNVTRFLRAATELATHNEEIAASCMFSVPRAGKMITGKSIRMAEICASAWGNLHVGSRVIDESDAHVTAQSVVWDLERNVRITVEAQRGIKSKKGRYDEDMIRTTGMAAISVAMRNAVFRVIPAAYTNQVYEQAKLTAVGTVKTLVAKRESTLEKLGKMGVPPANVFARLGILGINDITLEHLTTLIGLGTSIREGNLDVDAAFPAPVPAVVVPVGGAPAGQASPPGAPAPAAAPEGRRVQVGPGKRGRAAPHPEGPNAPIPPATPDASGAAAKPAETGQRPPAAEPKPAESPASPNASAPPATPPPEASPAAPAGEPPVNIPGLVLALSMIDDAWKAATDAREIVGTWSEAERREALAWANGVLNNSTPLADQMRRPAFLNIDAPPEGD